MNLIFYIIKKYCKKIILTTDHDLIVDGVGQISEEYLLEIIKELNNV